MCLCLIGTMMPAMVKAESGTLKSISLNAGVLRPASGKWDEANGNLLYFGTYEGYHEIEQSHEHAVYRVLSSSPDTQTVKDGDGENSATIYCLLLDCDTGLKTEKMAFDDSSNIWSDSDIREWLNGDNFYNKPGSETEPAAFSELERNAIAETTLKPTGTYKNAINYDMPWQCQDYYSVDHIFLLSVKEACDLYADNDARKKADYHLSSGSYIGPWWSRSATTWIYEDRIGSAAVVTPGGTAEQQRVNEENMYITTPAFNVKLSSILFVSTIRTDKTEELAQVKNAVTDNQPRHYNRKWKTTLLDSTKAIQIPDRGEIKREDIDGVTKITVPYKYDGENVTQISVMITDKDYTQSDAQVLYYGALKQINSDSNKSTAKIGRETFTLPDNLPNGYKVYILAEDVNGAKETDYAGTPCEVSIPVIPPAEDPDEGTDTPSGGSDASADSNNNADSAGTGDDTNIAWMLIPILISGAGIVAVLTVNRRKKRENTCRDTTV